MASLRILSGREICAILADHGFVGVRQKASHIVMQKEIPNSTITVPIPDHKEIKIGTLLGIIRQSQLPRKLFEQV